MNSEVSGARIDLSVIITAHGEGVLAGPMAHSALVAIAHVQAALDLAVEVLLVFDKATAVTVSVLEGAFNGLPVKILKTSEGDPGQARNRGVAEASGLCATFLDGDDLWSENWLTEAWKLLEARPDCVAHSACNLTFGNEHNLWWHVDSESGLFDRGYLEWGNYWDAMSFARTETYRAFPFRANDLKLGFGHEDWHWNVITIEGGVPHKPVPGTMHFKRRRSGSQMARVEDAKAVRWPLGV